MVHRHIEPEKDDDRWLYMPSLDLVKRIAAGDKRTSFVGSDFLYEDISGRGVNEDVHELMKTTDEHYILKNIPKKPDSVEFKYYIAYIGKKTFLPMKLEYYKKDERLYRVIESKKIELIEAKENDQKVSYPTVVESVARDLESGSTTVMNYSNVQYNIGIEDDIFTERYLRRPPRKIMQ
jgi:outer membrane lipoprotein-sorting protein